MALEVVKGFTLEHVRWLTPLEEHAVRAVKGAAIGKGEPTAETFRIYDLVTEAVRDADCWILCDCLPEGSEQPVIVPARGPNRIRLGNRPDAPLPHDGNCVFRLRGTSRGGTRYWFNPLTGDGHGVDPGGPEREHDTGSGPRRPVPEVAYLLKCFIREARLHTLAGAERFASPADALAELGRAAAAFPVAPGIRAAEVLFTDPAGWRSGEVRERLDVVARTWPRGPPRCGFLCWIAHDLEGHDINRETPGAGHVRVASPVVSPVIHDRRVEGPYLFLGVVAPSGDRQGWAYRRLRPGMLDRIEDGLRLARGRKAIPSVEEGRIAEMVGAELARLRDPGAERVFTEPWWGREPLLAGDRIGLRLSEGVPEREAVVRRPGWTGGCVPGDELEIEWIGAPPGRDPKKAVERISALDLAGRGVHRAEWRDERVREAERAHQFPAPPAGFPFPSGQDIAIGDRLWRTEVAEPDPAAPERPRATRPAVVRIEMEAVSRTAGETAAEDRCRLRERWRSDGGTCREIELAFDEIAAFAGWRAFWDDDDERWSEANAQKIELERSRAVLLQQGLHQAIRHP